MKDTDLNETGLQYGQVERILANVLGIEYDQSDPKGGTGIEVLRTRLRHLRNIGVPNLPRHGSGIRVLYSKDQALEMLLAVGLEHLGQTPRIAVMIAQNIMLYLGTPDDARRKAYPRLGHTLYAVIHPSTNPKTEWHGRSAPKWSFCIGSVHLKRIIDAENTAFLSVLNISRCMERFEQEVAKVATA